MRTLRRGTARPHGKDGDRSQRHGVAAFVTTRLRDTVSRRVAREDGGGRWAGGRFGSGRLKAARTGVPDPSEPGVGRRGGAQHRGPPGRTVRPSAGMGETAAEWAGADVRDPGSAVTLKVFIHRELSHRKWRAFTGNSPRATCTRSDRAPDTTLDRHPPRRRTHGENVVHSDQRTLFLSARSSACEPGVRRCVRECPREKGPCCRRLHVQK